MISPAVPFAPPAPPRPFPVVRWLAPLIRSGLFVACCAVALAYETSLLARVAPQPVAFYVFVLGATWSSYRLTSLRPSERVPWPRVVVTWAILTTTAICSLSLPLAAWPTVALLAALSWGYTRPTLPGVRRLREFGLMKITILTGAWTVATTLLPLIDRPIAALPLGLLLARRFLFLFALCVAFDVRDWQTDARAGIRTLPVLLGIARSYQLMRWTLVAFVGLVLLGPLALSSPGWAEVALVVSALVTWIAIEAGRDRSVLYYQGLVDGMMLLQAILVWALLWTSGR